MGYACAFFLCAFSCVLRLAATVLCVCVVGVQDPRLTIPERGENEQYKAAPGRVDASQLVEAGAHHTTLDDKDLV
jgi:hypothetical protein